MKKSFTPVLMTGLISLGIIGLCISLFQKTSQTLQTIVGFLLVTSIIVGAFYWFTQNKKSTDEKKYAQALRKNKKRKPVSISGQTKSSSERPANKRNILPLTLRKNKKAAHLYVIDGKKKKKAE